MVGKRVYWEHCLLFFYLWKHLLVCFSPSNEDCHRTLRHFLQLKWLNSWFSLTDCAQIPSCLRWKCALECTNECNTHFHSSGNGSIFNILLQCYKNKKAWNFAWRRNSERQLNDELQIWFSQKGIAICCAAEILCCHDSWSVRVFLHREESLGGAPVVSQFTAFLCWGPRSVNHYCCSAW